MKIPKPKKKKVSRKSLTKRLDKLWSLAIRSRGRCDFQSEKCSPQLQAAHIYSRKNRSTRWVLVNGLCLCVAHHFWAQQNPTEFGEFVIEKLGLDVYHELKKLAGTMKQFSVEDLLEIEGQLKSILEN